MRLLAARDVRILTGDYLDITQASALELLSRLGANGFGAR